jgi:hypothetical protein
MISVPSSNGRKPPGQKSFCISTMIRAFISI